MRLSTTSIWQFTLVIWTGEPVIPAQPGIPVPALPLPAVLPALTALIEIETPCATVMTEVCVDTVAPLPMLAEITAVPWATAVTVACVQTAPVGEPAGQVTELPAPTVAIVGADEVNVTG